MSEIKIKLCGMMRECDIEFAKEAGCDYVGFVFAESRRQVSYEKAEGFRKRLGEKIQAVGVFVDEKPSFIQSLYENGIIHMVQLHGCEDMEYILYLRELVDAPIIKAVRVRNVDEVLKFDAYPVDYLLLDTYVPGLQGGTGHSFSWDLIPKLEKPFFLAGGIGLHNIRNACQVLPYGIDVSSGIETLGFKDREKMYQIVKEVRNHDVGKCEVML